MLQFRWLWECIGRKQKLYILGLFLCALTAVMLIINPTLSKIFVDKIVVGTTNPDGSVSKDLSLLFPLLGAMCGIPALRFGLRYLMIVIFEISSQDMLVRMREHLYKNLSAQDMYFYDEHRTGDLMTRLTGDLDMVRHTASWVIYNLLDAFVKFGVAIIYFLTINVELTLYLLATTPLILLVSYFFSKTVRPLYVSLREKLAQMNTAAQENISGNRVVRAFAREEYECGRFGEKNANYRKANLKASLQWMKFYPMIEGLSQSLNIITLIAGGMLIINGKLTPGELMAFTSLTWCLSQPMRMLGNLLNDRQRFHASATKVMEIYYAKPSIVNCGKPYAPADGLRGEIEFKQVSFKYKDGTAALRDVSLHIKPGQTVAVMGSTGSGKTTLVNLIVRLCDASGGAMLIDGVDVKKWNLQTLRGGIGVATQDVLLFSDTVDGNIAYGNPDLPEEDVRQFAGIAAADFVDKLSNGFDTIIGERGTGLSGGQKQRIALARALAIRPRILILDDTTSAVDLETEKYIQEQLAALDFPCTKLIIAQRISSVKSADMIVILEDGKVAECGTHEELLKNRGYYYDIFALQHPDAKEVTAVGQK